MRTSTYEEHVNKFDTLPIFLYTDRVYEGGFFPSHWHEHIELLFITSGTILVTLNGENFRAKQGDIVVINPSVMHSIATEKGASEYDYLIIDKNFCEKFGFNMDEILIKEVITDDKLFCMIKEISYEKNAVEQYYYAKISADVLNILVLMLRKYPSDKCNFKANDKKEDMFKKALIFISENFKKSISVEDVASHVAYSKYYFCRRFKEMTGYTVLDYINTLKIHYAYNALINRDISITDIAAECGIHDVSYFTKMFKKYKHTLPSKIKQIR